MPRSLRHALACLALPGVGCGLIVDLSAPDDAGGGTLDAPLDGEPRPFPAGGSSDIGMDEARY